MPNDSTTSLKRSLGLFSCTMLVVGNMIGVGIFTTPGTVAEHLPTGGWILLAWFLGACLAMSGALSYAELGASFPQAGGNYVFLREAYGPLWGFLYGWTAAFITQAGTVAVLAIGFTKYAGLTDATLAKSVAVSIILIFGALNYVGVKVGSGSLNVITFLKILCIIILVLAGLFSFHSQANPIIDFTQGSSHLLLGLATALVPVMYTYSGWNATVYVGSEVTNPERTIPRSLVIGVIGNSLLISRSQYFYLKTVPIADMRGTVVMASLASQNVFGPSAQRVISSLIALSILGCVNATLLTAPRISYAMARDGYLLPIFGTVHPRFQTPAFAIALTVVWSIVLVFWGSFKQLTTYVTVPSLMMNTLTVSALFWLRLRKPNLPRPYKAWGYPVVPFFFVLMIAWIVVSELIQEPKEALAGLAVVSAGIPFYLYFRKHAKT